MRIAVVGLVVFAMFAGTASAAPHEVRVPLRQGKLHLRDLSAPVLDRLPAWVNRWDLDAEIELKGMRGSLLITALNQALGEGCSIRHFDDALVLKFDPEKLPRSAQAMKQSVRTFTANVAPEATAAQARLYGLLLPKTVNPQKPMVVLVHGLDCDRSNWEPLADLLQGEGYQVGYFTYASDQPVTASASSFAAHMLALRETFPSMRVDVIAHSMGALVARAYIEGEDYGGGIGRFIMIAPPNQGSKWATYRVALEVQEHYHLWRWNRDWQPSWMITDGLGEAAVDLKPGSRFLTHLNTQPRREGVLYTIIAGNKHPLRRMGANTLDTTAGWVPDRVKGWWGIRHGVRGLERSSEKLRHQTGKSDGAVLLESTRLDGVSDYVVVAGDHSTIHWAKPGQAPAAWAVIRERLKHEGRNPKAEVSE